VETKVRITSGRLRGACGHIIGDLGALNPWVERVLFWPDPGDPVAEFHFIDGPIVVPLRSVERWEQLNFFDKLLASDTK